MLPERRDSLGHNIIDCSSSLTAVEFWKDQTAIKEGTSELPTKETPRLCFLVDKHTGNSRNPERSSAGRTMGQEIPYIYIAAATKMLYDL